MDNIKIIPMNENDLKSIKDVLELEFDDFWNYNILYNDLKNSYCHYILAKSSDNIIIGFAGLQIILDEATVMNIVTKKNKRNLGIASKMLEYFIRKCKTLNLNSITLEVNANNTAALNLYTKYKFTTVGIRKNYYNNSEDGIIMTLFLK